VAQRRSAQWHGLTAAQWRDPWLDPAVEGSTARSGDSGVATWLRAASVTTAACLEWMGSGGDASGSGFDVGPRPFFLFSKPIFTDKHLQKKKIRIIDA